jgi:glycosyltransferase involved in cell wall biosynthesis
MSTEVIYGKNPTPDSKISIVVPTLNRASGLVKCLLALRMQSYEGFEILVVDNGPSTDDTHHQVLQLMQEDPRIVYICTTEKGDFTARNIGCHHAQGKLILTIDDDWLTTNPHTLQYILNSFNSDERLGVLGIQHDYWGTIPKGNLSWKGRLKRAVFRQAVRLKLYKPGRIRRWGYLSTNFQYLPWRKKVAVDHVRGYCMAFLKEPAEKAGFFTTVYNHEGYSYRGETELCCRLAKMGYRVICTSEVTGIHDRQPRADGTMSRGRKDPRIMFSQARSNSLFFLRNYWSWATAPLFLFWDFFVGNFRHPGLLHLLFSYQYFGKLDLVKASLKGKWSAFLQFYSSNHAFEAADQTYSSGFRSK